MDIPFIRQTKANSFGQESKGIFQIRGYGTLTLTASALEFVMLFPRRTWTIPLPCITDLQTPLSHLRKTRGRPLLKVLYRNEVGELDSIAWEVRELQEWINAIAAVTKKNH
jgi:hypothetical protein